MSRNNSGACITVDAWEKIKVKKNIYRHIKYIQQNEQFKKKNIQEISHLIGLSWRRVGMILLHGVTHEEVKVAITA